MFEQDFMFELLTQFLPSKSDEDAVASLNWMLAYHLGLSIDVSIKVKIEEKLGE